MNAQLTFMKALLWKKDDSFGSSYSILWRKRTSHLAAVSNSGQQTNLLGLGLNLTIFQIDSIDYSQFILTDGIDFDRGAFSECC